jgi:hypothetical protein
MEDEFSGRTIACFVGEVLLVFDIHKANSMFGTSEFLAAFARGAL